MDTEHPEVVLDGEDHDMAKRLLDAFDNASDQDKITWAVDGRGRRVAAIVPVDVAEYHDQVIAGVLGSSRHVLYRDVLRELDKVEDKCALCTHVKIAHTSLLPAPPEPRDTVDCSMCADGKCRTPAAVYQRDLETAARAGLLSTRHR
jgi:hypothetical protein